MIVWAILLAEFSSAVFGIIILLKRSPRFISIILVDGIIPLVMWNPVAEKQPSWCSHLQISLLVWHFGVICSVVWPPDFMVYYDIQRVLFWSHQQGICSQYFTGLFKCLNFECASTCSFFSSGVLHDGACMQVMAVECITCCHLWNVVFLSSGSCFSSSVWNLGGEGGCLSLCDYY